MNSNVFPNNIILDFNPQVDNKSDLESLVFDSYRKNQDFFGEKEINIKIKFIYQRSEMDDLYGYKTPEWYVGSANNNKIAIFSPLVFNKVSSHSKTDFDYILTHEIAHLFSNKILRFSYPKWLCEGIAGYVAEQYKIRPIGKIDEFSKLHNKDDWDKFHNYPQAFSFTKYLIDKFGKEKILGFLKNLRKNIGSNNSYNEFVKFFDNFLKIDFNEEVSSWLKSI